jgi:hypothetical protein
MRGDDDGEHLGTVVAQNGDVTLVCRGRDAKNAKTNGDVRVAIGGDKADTTSLGMMIALENRSINHEIVNL